MWTNLSLHPPNLICEIPVDRHSCDTSVPLEGPPAFSVYIAYLLESTKEGRFFLRRMTAIHGTTGQGLGLCHPVNLGARTFVLPAPMSMSEIVSKRGPRLEGIRSWGNSSSFKNATSLLRSNSIPVVQQTGWSPEWEKHIGPRTFGQVHNVVPRHVDYVPHKTWVWVGFILMDNVSFPS